MDSLMSWQQQQAGGDNATRSPAEEEGLWGLRTDPRLKDWPFMGGPTGVACLLALYLVGCVALGPRLMRNRKPLSLRPLLLAYNVFMVGASVHFAYITVKEAYVESGYSLWCQADDSLTSPRAMILFRHSWWYLLLKMTELLDTFFFVLRKKNQHISFLHVLHHTLALVTVWLDLYMGVLGQVALFPLLNSSVHIVMYTYYGLAALSPNLRPNLWWKKYVTQFQIAQFMVLTVHAIVPILHVCGFPQGFACFMAAEAALFSALFSQFYVRTYMKRGDKSLKDR
uniref:Elongation of very long chain fatty acids protein n=1 Tax=Ixodes ricinus TaxID=34613 RepID=A0A0K8RF79_IXORI